MMAAVERAAEAIAAARGSATLPTEAIRKRLIEREILRQQRDWLAADRIRKELHESFGVVVTDMPKSSEQLYVCRDGRTGSLMGGQAMTFKAAPAPALPSPRLQPPTPVSASPSASPAGTPPRSALVEQLMATTGAPCRLAENALRAYRGDVVRAAEHIMDVAPAAGFPAAPRTSQAPTSTAVAAQTGSEDADLMAALEASMAHRAVSEEDEDGQLAAAIEASIAAARYEMTITTDEAADALLAAQELCATHPPSLA